MEMKARLQKLLYQTLDFFFGATNALIRGLVKYPFLIIGLIVLLAIAILVLLVNKEANVGGLLGSLLERFGFKKPSTLEEANSIPKDRKQAIGEADKRGYVQHKVEELPTSKNPFRDKTKITLPNGKSVKLPEGLKDSDIDVVIEAKVDVVVVPKKEVYSKLEKTKQAAESATATNEKARKVLESLKAKRGE